MIEIDGSQGEGGGQILRSALALSLVTGQAFEIRNIRARRASPGLMRQHLTAVQAAARVGAAHVRGASIGSSALTFEPGPVSAGTYHFAIGTAGSATLVLQTILPPLLRAGGPAHVVLEGGTHNVHAPPFDFLAQTFAPQLARIGFALDLRLIRPGFYPAGGGEMHAEIRLAGEMRPGAAAGQPVVRPLELLQRGSLVRRAARAIVSQLPRSIAERELSVIAAELDWPAHELHVEEPTETGGPGNIVLLELHFESVSEVIAAFGARGVRAEVVAQQAAAQAAAYLLRDAPVGEHLADQLLLPMALGAGGVFRTTELSPHALTNMDVIRMFLPVRFETAQEPGGAWLVNVIV